MKHPVHTNEHTQSEESRFDINFISSSYLSLLLSLTIAALTARYIRAYVYQSQRFVTLNFFLLKRPSLR